MVMLATLGLTVFVDLITAVAMGLIAAGMAHVRQLEYLELDSVVSVPFLDRTFYSGEDDMAAPDPFAARVGMVRLKASFTVASSHRLVAVIGADIKDHEVGIFDFSGATYLDDSAAMVIEQLMDIARKEHAAFIVMGLSGTVAHTLHTLNILQGIPEGQVVETVREAREVARASRVDTGQEPSAEECEGGPLARDNPSRRRRLWGASMVDEWGTCMKYDLDTLRGDLYGGITAT